MLICYVSMNEDIVNPLLSKNFQRIYGSHYYKCPTKIPKSQVSHSKAISHTTNPKYYSIVLGKVNRRYRQRQERPDGAH